MLSDKQIQEISRAAYDIAVTLNMHPIFCLSFITSNLPCDWDEKESERKRCKQWLFDNQKDHWFSITKQDMLY